MSRLRLDEALVARGAYPSRARARDAVLRGVVQVNGAPAKKPAQAIFDADAITITDEAQGLVSRAGLKLIAGLDHFKFDVQGLEALDVGASTGGFTQVLLARGAARVTALDVGHDQLDHALRQDARVVVLEGFNARDLTLQDLPGVPEMIVCDVSFISLKLALAPALDFAPKGAKLLALIKPQFEAGREALGKGGILRDEAVQQAVCETIAEFIKAKGWQLLEIIPSPVLGGDGNQEFLLGAIRHSGLDPESM